MYLIYIKKKLIYIISLYKVHEKYTSELFWKYNEQYHRNYETIKKQEGQNYTFPSIHLTTKTFSCTTD